MTLDEGKEQIIAAIQALGRWDYEKNKPLSMESLPLGEARVFPTCRVIRGLLAGWTAVKTAELYMEYAKATAPQEERKNTCLLQKIESAR